MTLADLKDVVSIVVKSDGENLLISLYKEDGSFVPWKGGDDKELISNPIIARNVIWDLLEAITGKKFIQPYEDEVVGGIAQFHREDSRFGIAVRETREKNKK